MMLSAEPEILPYRAQDKNAVLALSLRAWQPVFAEMRRAVPAFVYHNFYPAGWEKRQLADLGTFLDEEAERVWLVWRGGQPVGWIGIRLHPEDKMGEIYVLAVDPTCQRQGIGRHLRTCSQSSQQDSQESQSYHLQTGTQLTLAVFPKPSVLFQPGKTALYYPSLRQYRKTVQFVSFGNLYLRTNQLLYRRSKCLTRVTTVSKDFLYRTKIIQLAF